MYGLVCLFGGECRVLHATRAMRLPTPHVALPRPALTPCRTEMISATEKVLIQTGTCNLSVPFTQSGVPTSLTYLAWLGRLRCPQRPCQIDNEWGASPPTIWNGLLAPPGPPKPPKSMFFGRPQNQAKTKCTKVLCRMVPKYKRQNSSVPTGAEI